jgi:hypothetical protein
MIIFWTPEDVCIAFNNFFVRNFSQPSNTNMTCLPRDTFILDSVDDVRVTEEYIYKILKNLDVTKGAGCDGIPPIFFVKSARSLSVPVAWIFNRCLQIGYFPNIWKQAFIVPIHKKGLRTVIENYRPISILNVLSKVFERVVHSSIYPLLARSIPTEQHGFIKRRSTVTNLGVFVDYVLFNMNGGSQVDVIYTDFEKAFDRVDHIILLRKLYELGVQGSLLRWFESYLRNRSQAVVVGGYCSDFAGIPSGVPQGSILGPLLYASYLYDVGTCFKEARFLMYADDTKIFMRVKNNTDCNALQADLIRLEQYYRENRIGININKCSCISFTRKKRIINFEYFINNIKIAKSASVKDLGVQMDSKLSFSDHTELIKNKAYKSLGFVLRVGRPFSDIDCLKVLYYCYVRSILEYCSIIWNPQYITYSQSLEKMQEKFTKHLNFRTQYRSNSYGESCRYHRLVTLSNRRILADMSFLHGICNGYIDSPELASKLLSFCAPKVRTRHTKLFAVTSSKTNYAQNGLVNRLHRTFNNKFNSTDIFHCSKSLFRRDVLGVLDENS